MDEECYIVITNLQRYHKLVNDRFQRCLWLSLFQCLPFLRAQEGPCELTQQLLSYQRTAAMGLWGQPCHRKKKDDLAQSLKSPCFLPNLQKRPVCVFCRNTDSEMGWYPNLCVTTEFSAMCNRPPNSLAAEPPWTVVFCAAWKNMKKTSVLWS